MTDTVQCIQIAQHNNIIGYYQHWTYLQAVDHSDDSKNDSWPACAQEKGKCRHCDVVPWPLCSVCTIIDVVVRIRSCLNNLQCNLVLKHNDCYEHASYRILGIGWICHVHSLVPSSRWLAMGKQRCSLLHITCKFNHIQQLS